MSFNLPELRSAYLQSIERAVLLQPADPVLEDATDDPFFHKRRRVCVRFTLPRGCFGTMVVKRLTLR